ncbi:MAG: hypothetical protein K9J13_01685 [Saprospiraceae bacterium]|nr:hypothetical protein [Saprospiraceae bacterium]
MKNLIITIIFSLIGLNFLNANTVIPPVSILELEEEAYVDDIPFDTKEVVDEYLLSQIKLEDEAYVDDIPFDTEKIVSEISDKTVVKDLCVNDKSTHTSEIVIINTLDELGIDIDIEKIIDDIKESVEYSIQVVEEDNLINEIKYRTIKLIYNTSTLSR